MFELAYWQAEALPKLKRGSVLVGGVGSGKSITSLAYFTAIDTEPEIVVLTTAMKRDSGEWFEDAMKMSLRNNIIVDSWNNIKKYTDRENIFFVFDEQRLVGDGAWVDAFYEIASKNHWILLSATPADQWVDLRPAFIANGFFDSKTQFNNEHVKWARFVKYPKIEGYFDEWKLERYRDEIYVEMPYLNTAVRAPDHIINVDFSREEQTRLWTDRWNIYEDVPLKDAGEMMRCLRKSANSHPHRLEVLKEICAKNPRVIVYYTHTYELEILRTLHTELDIPLAEWNGQHHEVIPDTERWIYLVQYQAGSEGWNCISTDTIVFYSLPYSYRQFEQAKGRIDRMNTKFETLHYYVLKSRAIIDQSIWKALTRKKNFQVSAFVKKAWPRQETRTRLN